MATRCAGPSAMARSGRRPRPWWRTRSRNLTTDQAHHDGVVEGPFVVEVDGEHYLIYSAGFYGNGTYRTYIARVDLLNGWVRDERLLIGTGSPALAALWSGPGHPSVINIGDGLFELYLHAWRQGTDRSTGDS